MATWVEPSPNLSSREWFGLPPWTRFEGDLPADLSLMGYVGDELAGTLAVVLFLLAVIVLVIVLIWVVVPVVLFLAGLPVAIFALATRLVGVSAWIVSARGRDCALTWRVRGAFRSRRAMRELAGKLERGEEPTIEGIQGALVAN